VRLMDRPSKVEQGVEKKGRDAGRRLARGLGWFSLGLGAAQVSAPGVLNRLVGVDDNPRNRTIMMAACGLREIGAGVGIVSSRAPTGWLLARVAGDALDLALLGAAVEANRNTKQHKLRTSIALGAVAGVTALDLIANARWRAPIHPTGRPEGRHGTRGKAQITVRRPVEEAYRYWHDVEKLPTFMAHLESVQAVGANRSKWRARAPGGGSVEWQAEIVDDRPNEYISWRTVDGADVPNSGWVRFVAAPGDRGTEVTVELDYTPPGGAAGKAVAKLLGEEPDQQIRDDLRRFKQVIETGEVVRSDGSPTGHSTRQQVKQRPAQPLP